MDEQKQKKNVVALVGFIISFFLSIAGLALSIIGAVNAKKCDGHWKGFAIAGIVISIVKLVFKVLGLIVLAAFLNLAVNISEGNYPTFIKCLDAENCVKNDNSTYTCLYNDESITCDFNIEEAWEDENDNQGDNTVNPESSDTIIDENQISEEQVPTENEEI